MDIKENIIEGAARCFVRYGYSKTTLDDIGKSVGLKKNSLYHYFKNKEEIFFVVLEREVDADMREREEALETVEGLKNKVVTYMNLKIQACNKQTIFHSILRDMWNERHPLFERVIALIQDKETAYLESLFNTAHRKHEIIRYDYRMLAESLLLINNSMKQLAMNNPAADAGNSSGVQYDKHIIFIIETLLKAVEAR